MKTSHLPAGYAHAVFDEVDSTNEEAKRRATAGERGPLWISAQTQTAGRGRRGREWVSPQGNLMATLLIAPHASAASAAGLSLVAALAVYDAVSSWIPDASIKVKWPNDVLVKGRKVSGILLETASFAEAEHLPWLAIGIGINLVSAPAVANYPATFVNDHAQAPDAAEALSVLAMAWDRRFQVWQRQGIEPIRQAWLDAAAGLGQAIEVRLAHDSLSGTFETLMADGSLLLALPSGEKRTITAGEVFFAPSKG
ncbi:MAG: biotin--[acetyl-CoA-carboxylase] ligase [Micropepsaceae bacterium]